MDTTYLQAVPRAVFNTASLTGSYQGMNGSGLSDDVKILKIVNNGTGSVDISLDGITDHDIVLAGQSFLLDLQANHASNSSYGSGTWRARAGQIFYGKGTAGTGNLYIIGYR